MRILARKRPNEGDAKRPAEGQLWHAACLRLTTRIKCLRWEYEETLWWLHSHCGMTDRRMMEGGTYF